MDTPALEKVAKLIRYYILTMTTAAGSGHATSSLSAVEIMTLLFFKYLRFDLDNPENPENDRVIFSKGHATPLLYGLYAAAGKITSEDIAKYRTIDSPLEGHPTRRLSFIDAAMGSLGQGLSVGVGEALAFRFSLLSNLRGPHVYVLLGDGEMAEGSVWEGLAWASKNKLKNLVALVDVNRLGQSEPTMYEYDVNIYEHRFNAFGWASIVVDGHDFGQLDAAFTKASNYYDGPLAIVAKTIKGRGVSFLENEEGWHGRALTKEELSKALLELGEVDKNLKGIIESPSSDTVAKIASKNFDPDFSFSRDNSQISPSNSFRSQNEAGQNFSVSPQPVYDKPTATRQAFGKALVRLGHQYPNLMVLDGDVKNSTYTELFEKQFPDRFLQMYIAEQNMVGVAIGLSTRGFIPCVSTFACFLSRAHDQIRMAGISGATILFNGSHAGVSIGADGPSQMGLEDIALFRSIIGSTVLYPADAVATERLVDAALKTKGISYIRTTRPVTPIIYKPEEEFPIGGSKIFDSRITNNDKRITIIAAGITVHEALKAQRQLKDEGIGVNVIDCYSIKPIDVNTLKKFAANSRALIVVEDHYPEGGLGEAVLSALSGEAHATITHLAVSKMPRSGSTEDLFELEGINAKHIIDSVKKMLS